jgi:isopenicillin N synthase-like dioxygenase
MSWGLMSHCLKQICAALIHKILSALALALPSLSESYLSDLHSASLFQLRLLHYPAIQKRVLSKTEATRISAHTDFGTLTLLWQDEVGGLEIMRPPPDAHSTGHGSATTDVHKISGAEEFIPVPPVPGAVLVNVGDLMERWSNGRWRSAVHRVGPPPQSGAMSGVSDRAKDDEEGSVCLPRYSIPFFATANSDAIIDALPGCWGPDRPKRYPSVTAGEYVQMRMAALY